MPTIGGPTGALAWTGCTVTGPDPLTVIAASIRLGTGSTGTVWLPVPVYTAVVAESTTATVVAVAAPAATAASSGVP